MVQQITLDKPVLPSESTLRYEQARSLRTQRQSALQQMQFREQQFQQQQAQQQQLNQLRQAAFSDPNALRQLSVVSPDDAKNITDYQNNVSMELGKSAAVVKTTPLPDRPAVYKRQLQRLQSQGYNIDQLPSEYDPAIVDPQLEEAIGIARGVEKTLASTEPTKREIKEAEGGFFAIDPITARALPVRTEEGVALQPKAKKPLVEVKTGDLETSFQKETGKKKAELLSDVLSSGDTASGLVRNLDAIETALDEGAFVGFGADKVASLNEIGAAFGFESDLDKASNTRVIQQRLNDLTLQATGRLKGAISEKELDIARRTIFDLGTSEQATRKAINTLRVLSSYDEGLADLASRLEQEGKFTTDFRKEKRIYDKEFSKILKEQLKEPKQEQKEINPKDLSDEELLRELSL